jgi:hypothetical protein
MAAMLSLSIYLFMFVVSFIGHKDFDDHSKQWIKGALLSHAIFGADFTCVFVAYGRKGLLEPSRRLYAVEAVLQGGFLLAVMGFYLGQFHAR